MMEKMSQDCERFLSLLDGYIDESLNETEMAFMKAHAKICPDCAAQMKMSVEMIKALSGMDDDIAVPLSAQNAWRQAVRREARAKKQARFTRWASGIAAALIVVAGSAAALRNSEVIHPELSENADAQNTYSMRRIASPAENDLAIARSVVTPYLVEADGGDGDLLMAASEEAAQDFIIAEDSAVMADAETSSHKSVSSARMENSEVAERSTPEEVAAPDTGMLVHSASRVAGSEHFDADRESLVALTDEYAGYFASDVVEDTGVQRVSRSLIRVPVDLMDEFMTALENIGVTHAVEVRNESVSAYYYDAESRLYAQRMITERILNLIPDASGSELQSLNEQLKSAYDQIDELERIMRAYQSEVSYANVSLTLYEVNAKAGVPGTSAVQPAATREPTLSERSSSGFNQSMSKIGRFFEDMIVSMAVIAPVVLIVAVAGAVVGTGVWLVKRRKKDSDNETDK